MAPLWDGQSWGALMDHALCVLHGWSVRPFVRTPEWGILFDGPV